MMDESDLLKELGELDDEDTESAKIYIQQLKKQVEEEKRAAIKEKKANNIEKAKNHLVQMKKLEKDLEEQYAMYP